MEVAAAEVKAARARLEEAQAILGKYEAEVERWDVQVKRLAREVERTGRRPPDPARVRERAEGDIAARDAAKATIAKAEAELQADEATLARAEVNVAVARADLAVAESEAKRLEAWVGYLKLLAPYDGIIVARNANTWDFVLPRTGDPTAEIRAPRPVAQRSGRPDLRGRSHRHRPDLRRYPRAGCQLRPCRVGGARQALGIPRRVAPGHGDAPLLGPQHPEPHDARRDRPAQSRQPDPAGDVCLRQGRRRAPDVRALPKAALTHAGGKSFIWRYENGHAVRTEIQTGIEDGEWIEVTNRRVKSKSDDRGELGTDRQLGTGAHRAASCRPSPKALACAGGSTSPGADRRSQAVDDPTTGSRPRSTASRS